MEVTSGAKLNKWMSTTTTNNKNKITIMVKVIVRLCRSLQEPKN